MIESVLRSIVPEAFRLLPPPMSSDRAAAMLLAIGLQESRFLYRRQGAQTSSHSDDGPAHGFWMFEPNGVRAVMTHAHTAGPITEAATALRYTHIRTMTPGEICTALEHNDVLACVFARCLLWTYAGELPPMNKPALAWSQYVELWRPGKPRRDSWEALYREAWARTQMLSTAPFRA